VSRVGKKALTLPKGVEVKLDGNVLRVKGPKGELSRKVHDEVGLEADGEELRVTIPEGTDRRLGAQHGLARALLANMVKGVTEGFERHLQLMGVGYRAQVQGRKLTLSVGFSHPVEMPKGLSAKAEQIKADQTNLTLSCIDNEVLGQFAASIRSVRPPEPYKGKGIRYADERIRRKEGKKGA